MHDCPKIFCVVFTSLKLCQNYKHDDFLAEKKVKPLHSDFLSALKTAFSTKLLLDGKAQNNGFWNISNLSSVAINMTFKSHWDFSDIKIYRKFKLHEVWAKFEMKICFPKQSRTKYCNQIHEDN